MKLQHYIVLPTPAAAAALRVYEKSHNLLAEFVPLSRLSRQRANLMRSNSRPREDDPPVDRIIRRYRRLVCLLLFAAACSLASTDAAGQVLISRQMAGNSPGCWGTGYLGNFRIDPILDKGGNTAYRIIWASFGSGTGVPLVQVAEGIAPARAVQFSPNAMSVSIDLPDVTGLIWFQVDAFDSGGNPIITTTPPASFPLRGAAAVYSGPGGYTRQTNGTSEDVEVDQLYTTTIRSSGMFATKSANFTGTIGTVTVAPGGPAFVTTLYVNMGTASLEVRKNTP